MSVFRVYVEKKPAYAVEAQSVLSDVRTALRLNINGVRILNRYDADHLTEEDFRMSIPNVFSEPAVDVVYEELPALQASERMFAVEYLPGQFDQRADSCEQCIQILTQKERCRVKNARIYIVSGNLTDAEFDRLKKYLINPVESREATLDTYKTLDTNYDIPTTVETLEGFIRLNEEGIKASFDYQATYHTDVTEIAGKTAVADYIASVALPADKDAAIKAIVTQRFLAGFMCDGIEAWSDWRIHNVPTFTLTQSQIDEGNLDYPYRMNYSDTDKDYNKDNAQAAMDQWLGGEDNRWARVWWDVADNN